MDRLDTPSRLATVEEILARAATLTLAELVRLAAAWRVPGREARARTLTLAVARASAQGEARRLVARAADAVESAAARHADGDGLWRLRQLDILWPAQMAVADAAVAALVADRLSPEVAADVTAAWSTVA